MGFLFNKKHKIMQAPDPIVADAYGQFGGNWNAMNNMLMPSFTEGMNNPVYQGETYAPMNPMMMNAFTGMGNFGGTAATAGANEFGATGGYGQGYAALNNALTNPNAAFDMGNSLANSTMADNLVNASTRDISRDLYENALPGADRRAVGSGNVNSVRAGIESGILKRGAADRAADVGAGIRNSLFNQGVGQYNTNIGQQFAGLNSLMNANNNAYNMASGGLGMMGQGGQSMWDYNQGANEDAQAQYYARFNNPMTLASQYKDLLTPFTGFNSGAGSSKGYANNSNAENIARLLTLGSGFGVFG